MEGLFATSGRCGTRRILELNEGLQSCYELQGSPWEAESSALISTCCDAVLSLQADNCLCEEATYKIDTAFFDIHRALYLLNTAVPACGVEALCIAPPPPEQPALPPPPLPPSPLPPSPPPPRAPFPPPSPSSTPPSNRPNTEGSNQVVPPPSPPSIPPVPPTDSSDSSGTGPTVMFALPFLALDMSTFDSNSSYYVLFREQFEQELLDAIACPGASVELLLVQAGSVLASTIARYPAGPLPGGSMSPAELEQAVASDPESLFSADFIDEYGPLDPAMVAQIGQGQGNEEDAQADPTDNGGSGIDMLILVIAVVGTAFATVLAVVALFLIQRRLRKRSDQGPSYAQVSSFSDKSRAGVQQGLMEITSEELQKALEGAQVLGKGGQAVVYRAHLPKVHRELVAIKKLTGAASSPAFAGDGGAWSFVEEARRLHQLGSNPNIINIYAICRTEGALVMELGQDLQPSLHDCLARAPFLPWRKRLAFLYDVASALWHVHSQGMLHLDIKPANIIIKQDGTSALLADFGMADEVQESGVASLRIQDSGQQEHVGTKIYKDPFVVNVFRPASDIYSLGVTIVEAVTGQMAHKMPELLSTEAVRGRSDSETLRRDAKAGLLSLLDQRDGVAGPSESDKEEWRRCSLHLLDLALNCMDTDYNVRPTAENLTASLLAYSKPARLPFPLCMDASSQPAPSAAPLSSGRRDAIKEQIQWHWRLVEKIVEQSHSDGKPLDQVKGKVKYFGIAIQCAIKDGLITQEEAKRYTRKNDRGNAAKHTRGRWAEIEKGLVEASGAPASSGLPDIPLEGIEKVDRQVRHHMDLVRLCQDAGLQDVQVARKKGKAIFTFENFNRTIQYAAENGLITDGRKAELMAINDEGNRWKHDELPGYGTNAPNGLQEDQITLQVVVEEPGSNVALGPPPPYKQRQLERADMLEEPLL